MSIRGPDIVTPGGHNIRGDYSRHSFSYVVPAGESGAGETVSMILRTNISRTPGKALLTRRYRNGNAARRP